MKVRAKLSHLRIAPRKVRLVANFIKGLDVKSAKAQLRFISKKSSQPILKLLNSAIANAHHNFNLEEENLYVAEITVNGGPSLKRWMPRAMGRVSPILKRTSHVILVLEEKAGGVLASRRKKKEALEEVKKMETPSQEPKAIKMVEGETFKKGALPPKPFGASGAAKKRYFSRQTFGNLKKDIKRLFRRKSI